MTDDRKLTFSLTVEQAVAARLVLADEGKLAPFDPAIEVLRRALERPTLDRSTLDGSGVPARGRPGELASEEQRDEKAVDPASALEERSRQLETLEDSYGQMKRARTAALHERDEARRQRDVYREQRKGLGIVRRISENPNLSDAENGLEQIERTTRLNPPPIEKAG